MGLDREAPLVVAPEHIQSYAGDEVGVGIEWYLARVVALAFVRDAAVQRVLGAGLGSVDGDVQLEVQRQGEPDHIEAGADIGGRGRGLDSEAFRSHLRAGSGTAPAGILLGVRRRPEACQLAPCRPSSCCFFYNLKKKKRSSLDSLSIGFSDCSCESNFCCTDHGGVVCGGGLLAQDASE